MDFHKLTTRFKQFGGVRLVWQYTKLGVLPVVVQEFFRCLIKRQSFKTIYPEVLKRVEPMLVAMFGSMVQEFKEFNGTKKLTHEHQKVIWWCWLQGFDNTPEIVMACHGSLKSNLIDYEIRIIDSGNWSQYVQLPDYIVERWNKKQIPSALFSDLLRLQLLIEYGGSWIDSTVLCTGFNGSKV